MTAEIVRRTTVGDRTLHGDVGSAVWARRSATSLPDMRSVAVDLGLVVTDDEEGWTATLTYDWPRDDCGDERTMVYKAESITRDGEINDMVSFERV